jgi:hypothetical protein
MSINGLSTELDTNIAEYCDHGSLLALSSTSRYWQALSEPLWYEHVRLTAEHTDKVKILLLTLLDRPSLAQHIRTIYVDSSAHPEDMSSEDEWSEDEEQGGEQYNENDQARSKNGVQDGKVDFNSPEAHGTPASGLEVGIPSLVPIKEHEQAAAQQKDLEQRLRGGLQAASPEVTQIIESAWPQLSDSLKSEWVQGLILPDTCHEPYLALILTLATNLEVLDLQYTKEGVTLTSMILHYHRTSEEIASTEVHPFFKLTELSLRGLRYPVRSGKWMLYWMPLPVNATELVLRDYYIDHFEYPSERDMYDAPQIETLYGVNPLSIKQLHPGYTPTLRTLDLSRWQLRANELVGLFATGYCVNLEVLRLSKMGRRHYWYDNINWPEFSHCLAFLLNLRDFEISI